MTTPSPIDTFHAALRHHLHNYDNQDHYHRRHQDQEQHNAPSGSSLSQILPEKCRSLPAILTDLSQTIIPTLTHTSATTNPHYYAFVSGALHPAALAADNAVTVLDQNVMINVPPPPPTAPSASGISRLGASAASGSAVALSTALTPITLESTTLVSLLSLLRLPSDIFRGRTFTTGATASNILALSCALNHILTMRLTTRGILSPNTTPSNLGFLETCTLAGVRSVKVLTSAAHSSLSKAASITGIGRCSIIELPLSEKEPWRLDIDAVEKLLQEKGGTVYIICISAGEVNTGRFATTGLNDMKRLREVADQHRAWVHVDGAFGIFARALPDTPIATGEDDNGEHGHGQTEEWGKENPKGEFTLLKQWTAGLELADSITADGHKCLNVPYDTGIFFSRHLAVQERVCSNGSAAYLPGGSGGSGGSGGGGGEETVIPSPMNIGIENSRRFRALPVYAVLQAEGRQGMADMFARMVRMARKVAVFVRESEEYELLPKDKEGDGGSEAQTEEKTFIIVLFRAKDNEVNKLLVDRINATGKMYISGTVWEGKPACRVAVASWRVDPEEDIKVVREVLGSVCRP